MRKEGDRGHTEKRVAPLLLEAEHCQIHAADWVSIRAMTFNVRKL